MDLSREFDKKLQETILSVGNVAAVRNDLAKRLAEILNERHPEVPVLLVMKTAESLIDTLISGTLEHYKGDITPAKFGECLNDIPLQQKLLDSGFTLFQKAIAQVRYEKRVAAGLEFARSNTAPKEGVAIDGVVYGR